MHLYRTGFKKDGSYNQLKSVLTSADLVKFAKYTPEPAEHESIFQDSWNFVLATKEEPAYDDQADSNDKRRGGKTMTRITFAEPLFLYLLAVVPAMIAFYLLKQQKTTASLRMPGLQPFAETVPTFRHYLRHALVRIPY